MQTQAIAINQGLSIGQTGMAVGMPQAAGQDGDFMQLIMQMMGQNPDDLSALANPSGGDISMEELLGLGDKKDEKAENTDYLMELMAGMVGHGMPQIAMYNEGGGSTAEQAQAAATEILSAMQTVAEAQTTGASANPTTTQQLLQNAVQFPTWSESLQQNGQTVGDGKQLVPDGKAVAFPGKELESMADMPIEVLTKDYNPAAVSTEARTAESQITDAFLQLGKQTIAQAATGKKQSAPIDIDTLQQAVDSGKFLSREATAPQELFTTANPQTMDILAQVKTGILANMQKGSNEFTIKLKPEGLGEITVKMTEAGGKVSMSIITGSQQTQNILNGEISSLREALRPMGAEISQVITQQEANLAQQSFSQQQQHSGKQEQRASHEWTQQTKEDEQSLEQYASALKSALNAYI